VAAPIEGILEQFLASDRFFQRRRRATTGTTSDPTPLGRGS
jgi:hypothetical protein